LGNDLYLIDNCPVSILILAIQLLVWRRSYLRKVILIFVGLIYHFDNDNDDNDDHDNNIITCSFLRSVMLITKTFQDNNQTKTWISKGNEMIQINK